MGEGHAEARTERGGPIGTQRWGEESLALQGQQGGQQKRGGRNRCCGRDLDRNRDHMSVFFGCITSYSEHSAFYISGRSEDIIMLAETHQNKSNILEMISGLRKNGWQATASPAMDSDKSIFGNIA